jgi:hypothetical protein
VTPVCEGPTMPRPNLGYLYQRPGSSNWWIELQYPRAMDRKRVRKSLGTTDKREAEIKAGPMVLEHRKALWEHGRGAPVKVPVKHTDFLHPLGQSVLDDGTVVTARHDLARFERNGETWEEENYLVVTTTMEELPRTSDDPLALLQKPPQKSVDDDIEHIERWIKHKTVNPYLQREAREAFRLFKELSGNKRFAAASRDDGRLLVDHLFASGNKRATVKKKISLQPVPGHRTSGRRRRGTGTDARGGCRPDPREPRRLRPKRMAALCHLSHHRHAP